MVASQPLPTTKAKPKDAGKLIIDELNICTIINTSVFLSR
jgi:hypothetical protein